MVYIGFPWMIGKIADFIALKGKVCIKEIWEFVELEDKRWLSDSSFKQLVLDELKKIDSISFEGDSMVAANESLRLASVGLVSDKYVNAGHTLEYLQFIGSHGALGVESTTLQEFGATLNKANQAYVVDTLQELGLVFKRSMPRNKTVKNVIFLTRFKLDEHDEEQQKVKKSYAELVDLLKELKSKLGVNVVSANDAWVILELQPRFLTNRAGQCTDSFRNHVDALWKEGKGFIEVVQRHLGIGKATTSKKSVHCFCIRDHRTNSAPRLFPVVSSPTSVAMVEHSGLVHELSATEQIKLLVLSRGNAGIGYSELSGSTRLSSKAIGRYVNGEKDIFEVIKKKLGDKSKYNATFTVVGREHPLESFSRTHPDMIALEDAVDLKDKDAERKGIIQRIMEEKGVCNVTELTNAIVLAEKDVYDGKIAARTMRGLLAGMDDFVVTEISYEDIQGKQSIVGKRGVKSTPEELREAASFKPTGKGTAAEAIDSSVIRIYSRKNLNDLIQAKAQGQNIFEYKLSGKGTGEPKQALEVVHVDDVMDLVSMREHLGDVTFLEHFYDPKLMNRVRILHGWLLRQLGGTDAVEVPFDRQTILLSMPLSKFLIIFSKSSNCKSANCWSPDLCKRIADGVIANKIAADIQGLGARTNQSKLYIDTFRLLGVVRDETSPLMNAQNTLVVRQSLVFRIQSEETGGRVWDVTTDEDLHEYYEWLRVEAVSRQTSSKKSNQWFSRSSWALVSRKTKAVEKEKAVKPVPKPGKKRKQSKPPPISRKKAKVVPQKIQWDKNNEQTLMDEYWGSHDIGRAIQALGFSISKEECLRKISKVIARDEVTEVEKVHLETRRFESCSDYSVYNKLVCVQIWRMDSENPDMSDSSIAACMSRFSTFRIFKVLQENVNICFSMIPSLKEGSDSVDLALHPYPAKALVACYNKITAVTDLKLDATALDYDTLKYESTKRYADYDNVSGSELLRSVLGVAAGLSEITGVFVRDHCEIADEPHQVKGPPKIPISDIKQHVPEFRFDVSPIIFTTDVSSSNSNSSVNVESIVIQIQAAGEDGLPVSDIGDSLKLVQRHQSILTVPFYDHLRLVHREFGQRWTTNSNIVVRKWTSVDGATNEKLLRSIRRSLISLVYEKPGISVSALHGRFFPVLDPVDVDEIVGDLMEAGVLEKQRFGNLDCFSVKLSGHSRSLLKYFEGS